MNDLNKLLQENKKLHLAVNELSILNDLASSISTIQPVEKIIDKVVLKCIQHLNVEEGTISLLEEHEDDQKFMTMIRKQDLTVERVPIHLDHQIIGWMLREKSPLLSNDFKNDKRFTLSDEMSTDIRNMLSVPLIVKGKLIGYLAVFNKKGDQEFEVEDRRLLVIIASQTAQIIENARLYKEEQEYLQLKEEMRVATEIQKHLLPDQNPEIEGYTIAAMNIPAKEIGGDYFDFIELNDGQWGFCVGDITGKGIPAALLMANLQASLRSQALLNSQTDFCLKNINKLLHRNTESTKFATLFYGVLDPSTHTISYCNAGHDEPIVIRKNKPIHSLKATGMLLGVIEGAEYQSSSIQLESEDVLVFFTDGVTEAMNNNFEEFGLERTIETSTMHSSNSAHDILSSLYDSVKTFVDGHTQSDDITIMVIKREK